MLVFKFVKAGIGPAVPAVYSATGGVIHEDIEDVGREYGVLP
jgi:hypothetical protein